MTTRSQYKIEKVARKYTLESIGDELAERWTRETNAASLRELATYFNERVLREAMKEAGMSPLDGEVKNTYRLLSDEDVSSGVRTEARKRLEQSGVDLDQVESDFVTYQAIRSYLQDSRGLSYRPPSDEERIESVDGTIKQLQNRTVSVTEAKVTQLRETDRVDLGQFRVLLELRVLCEDCGNQYNVDDLLERGGCDCEQ